MPRFGWTVLAPFAIGAAGCGASPETAAPAVVAPPLGADELTAAAPPAASGEGESADTLTVTLWDGRAASSAPLADGSPLVLTQWTSGWDARMELAVTPCGEEVEISTRLTLADGAEALDFRPEPCRGETTLETSSSWYVRSTATEAELVGSEVVLEITVEEVASGATVAQQFALVAAVP